MRGTAIKFFASFLAVLTALNLPVDAQGASVNHDVPNLKQVPTGNWADSRQKYGCEEASILMAWAWLNDKFFSPQQTEAEIISMADFESQMMFGLHHDTSAADTAKLMREYYGAQNLRVEKGVTVNNLKQVLAAGQIAIIPVGFTSSAGPFYPRPIARHTVVVRGYDEKAKTFGINDPLHTKELWIPEKILAKSLRDYQTGINRAARNRQPAMIVVGPK